MRGLLIAFAGALLILSGPPVFAKGGETGTRPVLLTRVADLRPGQSELGYKEVEIKLNHFLSHFGLDLREYRRLRRETPDGKRVKEILSSAHFENFLSVRNIEVIRDPKGELHIIDGHHLALSYYRLNLEWTDVEIHKDFLPDSTRLTPGELAQAMKEFESYMEKNGFVRLTDSSGRDLKMSDLPKSILKLGNDPFRSLAWLLKKAGLFEDKDISFQEFQWGDFLREKFQERGWKTDFTSDAEFMTAVNRALDVAEEFRSTMKDLPGAGSLSFKAKQVRKSCEKLLSEFSL